MTCNCTRRLKEFFITRIEMVPNKYEQKPYPEHCYFHLRGAGEYWDGGRYEFSCSDVENYRLGDRYTLIRDTPERY